MQIEIIKRIKELQKGSYLPLYGDLQYKYIFGISDNIKYTTRLLESLFKLERGSLDGSIIDNEVTLDRETVNTKAFELDVVVILPDGERYNLEIQKKLNENAEIKNTMYITKLFSSGVKRGEKYNKMKKVTQIEFAKKDSIHKSDDMIKIYHISNDKNPSDKILENLFEIIIVDIEKRKGISYNEDVDNEFEDFVKVISADSLESALEAAGNNLLLLEMIEKMVRFNNNDYVQDYAREQALIESNRETEVEEAENRGRKEGEKSKTIEIAMKMLEKNKDIEEIILFTDLTKAEIEALREKLRIESEQ